MDSVSAIVSRPRSHKKLRAYFLRVNSWLHGQGNQLTAERRRELQEQLDWLDAALTAGDLARAEAMTVALEAAPDIKLSSAWWVSTLRTLGTLLLIAVGAVLVRHCWFELYMIPTGSMRPTFREQDHLLVTKTAFSLNKPLGTGHLLFDPSQLPRTGVVVWSGEGIDLLHASRRLFGVFPTSKRYIKRLIGKPGDILYFYGGRIYGLDKDGRDISDEFDQPWMKDLEFVPFTTFEGQIATANAEGSQLVHEIYLQQAGMSIGKLILKGYGKLEGQIFDGRHWIEDSALAQKRIHDTIQTYTDHWGMRNFAMARLLTKEQVRELSDFDPNAIEDAVLYLELRHSPNLVSPAPRFQQGKDDKIRLMLTPQISVVPLRPLHLRRLMESMSTSRFVVQGGRAAPYSSEGSRQNKRSPLFSKTPDGTYEFIDGVAYSVGMGGRLSALSKDHPLYRMTPTNIQRLYNLGIELDSNYAPLVMNQVNFPSRYVYFREGDLYAMGKPLIKAKESTLQLFLAQEMERQRRAPSTHPYVAFVDHGSPMRKGRIDKSFMYAFGLKVPKKSYFVLGDNHASSADSRYFGFVPEANLQGAPSYIFWPLGPRWGAPEQAPYAWATMPRALVWGLVWALLALLYAGYCYRSKGFFFQSEKN